MESFGEYLKSLREEKAISLEEMSQRTKVAYSNLEFLEKDRFELLPPRVFVKGFIRSYVAELGLDPSDSLRLFDEFVKQGEVSDYEIADSPLFRRQPAWRSILDSSLFTIILSGAGILALSILVITGITRMFVWDGKNQTSGPSVTVAGPAGAGTQADNSSAQEVPQKTVFAEPPRSHSGRKVLEIKALANTWLRVQSDAGQAEEVVMAPGDVEVFTAKTGFQLQTGNAGGIRLRFEGKELPPLGKNNQSLSLTLP